MIEFTVRGNPKALKRHRTGVIYRKGPDGKPIPVKTKDGRVMTHEYDPSAEDKKDFLAVVERNVPPVILEGPLCLEVFMYFLRPKNHYGSGRNEGILKESAPEWHFGKPDADNVVKFIKDALNTKYYRDDGQVSILFAVKRFAKNYPYIHVRIKTVDEFMESVDHQPKHIVMPVKKIWEIVKEIEDHEQNHISDIGECKATLVVNYGELGRCRPGLLKKETGRLMPMLIDVLEWYEKKLNEYEKA